MSEALRQQLQASLGSSYTIERELGGGGMSRVYTARDEALGRSVVVKVLSPELAATMSIERFAREIRVAASLQQANIVPVLAAGESGGLPFYTMPFVEGLSLRQRLERGPVTIAECVSLLRDVARALAYAHARGIVHRDIKPDNVLLSGDTAVVTDFGIAKAIAAARTRDGRADGLTQVGMAVGTPAYMAPEQAAADPDTDHRADIYSFGCLAYELLAGHAPFHGVATHKLMSAHMTERPPSVATLRRDTPMGLASLVARCLEKDPDRRPQDASELLRALNDTSAGDAQAARVPHSLPVTLAMWLAAAAVVALLARMATIVIGLPDWVPPGALGVMGLALPLVVAAWTRERGGRAPVTSLRVRRGTAMALGAFVVLVATYMALRVLGIGPAGTLMAAGRLAESPKLLVADFNVPGADSSLGRVVSEAVKASLGESRVVRLLPSSSVTAALVRMRQPASTRLSGDVAREVAQREGVAAIVEGDVATLGASYVLTVRLRDASSGDELATAQETARDANDLIPAIDRASRTLRGRIGESLKAVRAAPPLERATTASMEALRAFTAGRLANGQGRYAEAVAYHERAIALDSNFARAYLSLMSALANSQTQFARQDTLVARAWALRDRLPEKERLRVVSAYHMYSWSRGYDPARALAANESSLVLEPDAPELHIIQGNFRRERGMLVAAESAYRRAIALSPDRQTGRANLGALLAQQYRWAAADSVLASDPVTPAIRAARTIVHILGAYARGQVDSTRALVRVQLASGDSSATMLQVARSLALLGGRLTEAEQRLVDLRRAQARAGNPSTALADSILMAMDDVWQRGDPARAVRRLGTAVRVHPVEQLPAQQRPLLILARAYALAGDAREAKRWLARYDAEVTEPTRRVRERPQRSGVEALIAVLERRWGDALRNVDVAGRDVDGGPLAAPTTAQFDSAYVFAAAGQTAPAIASFEHFLATRDLLRLGRPDADRLAFALERLAALYEESGQPAKAMATYARFVALWRDADPELQPRVLEARRRIARLRARTG